MWDAGRPASREEWLRRRRWGWTAELLLVVCIAVIHIGGTVLAAQHQTAPRALDPTGILLLAVPVLLLPGRRRWPVVTYAGVFAATLTYTLMGFPGGPIWIPLIISLATVLLRGHRLIAYLSLPLGYFAFLFGPVWTAGQPRPSLANAVGVGAWMLLLVAASELVRNRRAYLREARKRRREAEHSRIEANRRQASEQRLAIARELHDVLAHSISLINVQAGVALELMDQRPEQTRASLVAIKQVSKDALVEVQAMLRPLREPNEAALRTPTPSLRHLAELTSRASATGLDVRLETIGGSVALSPGVDLAAYRIIQEALTNVVRHADATTVNITITYLADDLCLAIIDNGPVRPRSDHRGAGGSGILGMRERADALGGHLEAGHSPGGGFRVSARLPLQHTQPAAEGDST